MELQFWNLMCRLAETQHASSVPRAKLDLADLHVTVERLKGRKRVDGGKTRDQRGIRPDGQTAHTLDPMIQRQS